MGRWEGVAKSNEWYTPKYIFDALECEFDLDVAAPVERKHCHVPAKAFITENSLLVDWYGFIWMNAPFGNRNGLVPWLDKIRLHNNGIALVPDRTSAPWWQRAAKQCDAIFFINHKVRFVKPDGTTGDSPSCGTTLFAYGEIAKCAFMKAQANGLGIVLRRKLGYSDSGNSLIAYEPFTFYSSDQATNTLGIRWKQQSESPTMISVGR
ncbi:MAG: hypothetical protein KF846_11630 [Cyclobacteriaceae bacterium]|nr:hypothetical protein [Cyclobacteriaceae bacterium]MBX2961974.1 hypothetical protein [Cyclobacteriaceae bacterium]